MCRPNHVYKLILLIALCAALIGLCLLLYGAKYLRLLRQSEQNNGDAGKSSSRTV